MRRPSESWFVALLLLLFVAAGIWLLWQSQGQQAKAYPPYSSFSPRPQGLMAYFELLKASGAEPQQHIESIYHYPDDACMVLATEFTPDFSEMFGGPIDERRLRLWLEDGGRLLLICDRESVLVKKLFIDELELEATPVYNAPPGGSAARISGGQAGQISALSRVYKPGEIYELDQNRAQLWADIERLEMAAPYGYNNPELETLLGVYDPNFSAPDIQPLVLRASVGKGEVLWLTAPELLSNKWIGRMDNHRLGLALASLAMRPREPGGPHLPLFFDERIHGYGHEGLNEVSVLTQTSGGRLLLAAAGLIVLLFLGAAIRPARFYPQLVPQRRQATEMVLAQADLYRRAGARFTLAESLVEGLKRAWAQSRHVSGLPSDRALLEWLDRSQQHEPAVSEFLRSKIMPPVPRRLLELAQACDRLRRKLEQGVI